MLYNIITFNCFYHENIHYFEHLVTLSNSCIVGKFPYIVRLK